MEEESNGELAFLATLLNQNNEEIFVLVYRKPTHTDQYLQYSCKESVEYSIFHCHKKDDLYKENARIKQVLKEHEHQENIINKIFKRVTACLIRNI